MPLNDVQLVGLRQTIKHFERTVESMVNAGAGQIGGPQTTQLFHEAGRIIGTLKGYSRQFKQTERAINNAMRVRPRQQIGAFGPQQARSRMLQLKQTEQQRDATLKRVLRLVGGGPIPRDFQHKGLVDIVNKIEKMFTEIGEVPVYDDGPVFLPGQQPAGGGWVGVLHVMVLILELLRARQAGK